MIPVLIFIVSCVTSALLCFPLRSRLIRWKMIAIPTARSSHAKPTVTGAGVAILLATSLEGLWYGLRSRELVPLLLQIAVAGGAIVSFADDRKSLPISQRAICQAVMAFWGFGILRFYLQHMTIDNTAVSGIWSGLLVVLWLLAFTNSFNFMDGIDGLAAAQATVTGFGMTLLAVTAGANWTDGPVLCCLSVAGGTAGFLPHNFSKARMFMGDVGSISIGYILGFAVIWISLEYSLDLLVPLILLHANFIFDATITLFRRIWNSENWRQGHREHFYQRLVRSGWSHATVTLTEMILQIVVLGLMLRYWHADFLVRIELVGLVITLWLAFFGWCEFNFRRNPAGLRKELVAER